MQSATWTDSASNSRTETANVDSLSSPGIQLQVFTGLAVTSTPATSAKVGQTYTYTVQTNAPSGDTVTVHAGHVAHRHDSSTRRRRPSPGRRAIAQLNTSPAFSATVSDSLGNTASIGPVDIAVALGRAGYRRFP